MTWSSVLAWGCALCLLHCWRHQGYLKDVIIAFRIHRSRAPQSEAVRDRARRRFVEIKGIHMQHVACTLQHVLACLALFLVLLVAAFDEANLMNTNKWICAMLVLTILYVLASGGQLREQFLHKRVSVDACYLFLVARMCCLTADDALLFSPLRQSLRMCCHILDLDTRRSLLATLATTVICCYVYLTRPLTVSGTWQLEGNYLRCFLCLTEIFGATLSCVVSFHNDKMILETLRVAIRAEDAWRTVEKLLAGFCDAVAHLDSNLCFRKPSPQLCHLICPGGSIDCSHLDGKHFTEFLASESDRIRFKRSFVDSEKIDSGPNSNTSLSDFPFVFSVSLSSGASVELFHVCSSDLDGSKVHHIGLRQNVEIVPSVESGNTSHRGRGTTREATGGTQNPVKPLRTSSFGSSRSSRSASSYEIVPMPHVAHVQFTVASLSSSLDISEYRVCFASHFRKPPSGIGITSLICPPTDEPFTRWVGVNVNEMLNGTPSSQPVFPISPVIFRMPCIGGVQKRDFFVANCVQLRRAHPRDADNQHAIRKVSLSTMSSVAIEDTKEIVLQFEGISSLQLGSQKRRSLAPVDEDTDAYRACADA